MIQLQDYIREVVKLNKGKYKDIITDEELNSGVNIAKKLARKYFEKDYDCVYEYDEYLSAAYYALANAIKYYDKTKASFARLVYIRCENDLKMIPKTKDKRWNCRKRSFEPTFTAHYSLNESIKNEKNKNREADTLEDLVGEKTDEHIDTDINDYIHRIMDGFYSEMCPRSFKRYGINKERDIKVIKSLIKGYTPMEVSKAMGISNQLVNSIVNKFADYARKNNIMYQIC